jgi:hypothetical protein
VTTLPKMITVARGVSMYNLLFYLSFSLLTLPKKRAFGKVTWMGKRRLLPQMTASLYLGRDGRLLQVLVDACPPKIHQRGERGQLVTDLLQHIVTHGELMVLG